MFASTASTTLLPPTGAPGSKGTPPASPAALTVLVVEDEPSLADLLNTLLSEERGWQVLLASSGEQALRVIQQSQPHLFLFDNNLSGAMTGLDLFDCLRQQVQYASVPTVLMSAYLPSREALQSRGVVGVQKPYDLDELLDVLDGAARRAA